MPARRIWWLVILSVTGTMEASAQEPKKTLLASLGRTTIVPVEKRAPFEMEKEISLDRPGRGFSLLRLRLPLADRVTEEKGQFRTETRLPLVGVWNGRLQLSCVHQRQNFRFLHPAYVHSTRYQAPLYTVGAPLPRSRENYGVTLSLHFGRRNNQPAPAPTGISGAGR